MIVDWANSNSEDADHDMMGVLFVDVSNLCDEEI